MFLSRGDLNSLSQVIFECKHFYPQLFNNFFNNSGGWFGNFYSFLLSRQYDFRACTVISSLLMFSTVRQRYLYCHSQLAHAHDSTLAISVLSFQACSCFRQYTGINCTVISSSLLLPTVRQHQLYCHLKLAPASDSTPGMFILSRPT